MRPLRSQSHARRTIVERHTDRTQLMLHARVAELNQQAWALCDEDAERAYATAAEALAVARQAPPTEPAGQMGIAYALRTMGYLNMRRGRHAEAVVQLLEAQPIAEALVLTDCQADVLDGLASVQFQIGNVPEALELMLGQLAVASTMQDSRRITNANNNLACVYNELGETTRSIELLERNAIMAAENGDQRMAFLATANLAESFLVTDRPQQALDLAQQSLEIAVAAGFEIFQTYATTAVGLAHLRLGDTTQAIEVLASALALARQLESHSSEAIALRHLAEAHWAAGDADAGLAFLHECIACAQGSGERHELWRTHLLLSQIHEQQGDPSRALEHFRLHHTLREEIAGERADQRLKVLQVQHDTATARREAELAAERADVLQRDVVRQTSELRRSVEMLNREVLQREQAQRALSETLESLEQRLADRTEELAAFFDLTLLSSRGIDLPDVLDTMMPRIAEVTRSRAVCIHLLSSAGSRLLLAAEQDVPHASREALQAVSPTADFLRWLQEPNDPLVTASVSGAVGLPDALRLPGHESLLAVQIRNSGQTAGVLSCYRFTGRGFSVDEIALVTALAEQVGMVLETDRLRNAAQAAAAIEERQRLARDLHDSVSQSLYSLSLLSRAARSAAADGDTLHLLDSLTELEHDTLHTLREMRLLLFELRPADLENAGLVEALEFRLNTVERRTGLHMDVQIDSLAQVDSQLEVELYYLIVEALNNIVKHAAAAHIHLRVGVDANAIRLHIADDGIGFDPHTAGSGFGLRGMSERVSKLQGRLQVSSEPGQGTRIDVVVPLQPTEPG